MYGKQPVIGKLGGIITGLVVGLVVSVVYLFNLFNQVEYLLYDEVMRLRGPKDPGEIIVIVVIDEDSLQLLGHWPWPRSYHGELIEKISKGDPKVIGVDIAFLEPDSENLYHDLKLIRATEKAANVIFPVLFVQEGDTKRLVRLVPIPELAEAAYALGHTHIEHTSDGMVRKVYLSQSFEGEYYWSFAVEVVKRYLHFSDDQITIDKAGYLNMGDDIRIPVQLAAGKMTEGAKGVLYNNCDMYINFAGDRGTFEYIPFYQVLGGSVSSSYFRGKIVLLGGTATGLFDSKMTPLSSELNPMPGVEVQANIINSILQHDFIYRIPKMSSVILILIVSVLTGILFKYLNIKSSALALCVACAANLFAYGALFINAGYWIDEVPLLVATFSVFVAVMLVKMGYVSSALDRELVALSRLRKLSKITSTESDLTKVFQETMSLLRELFSVDVVIIVLLDKKMYNARVEFSHGLSGEHADLVIETTFRKMLLSLFRDRPNTILSYSDSVDMGDDSETVAESKAISRYKTDEDLLTSCYEHNGLDVGSSLYLPLTYEKSPAPLGILVAGRKDTHAFTLKEVSLLDKIGTHIAESIYDAGYYGKLQLPSFNPLKALTYRNMERKVRTIEILMQSALHEEDLREAILYSVTDGVIISDILGKIILCNPKAKEILDTTREDIEGQSVTDFIQRFYDMPAAEIKQMMEEIIEDNKVFTTEVALGAHIKKYYILSVVAVRGRSQEVEGIMGVFSDITRLKEIDQMKTELMSMVTHELRTPLATIKGFSKILMDGKAPEEKAREFVTIINSQAVRLADLVNDFLDIARIESGSQAMVKTPLKLDTFIGETLLALKPLADEKEIVLLQDVPAGITPIVGDKKLITQVLINFVSNAIKYSPNQRQVTVRAQKSSEYVTIEVTDQGYGIPPEAIPRLFEKFYRVRTADTENITGTGLGLALVKQIIEVHDGKLHVESEVGKGSTFSFSLPKTAEVNNNR